ncbi:type IIL restriction-modification enzyme MmeI, partial [Acidithiobacillus caldus]|uniref:type IIL restriction-modification enzyme MmeI n=1 Tax=Acidithiobacillus caldus TaxID=33059 RepID=UPI001F523AE6
PFRPVYHRLFHHRLNGKQRYCLWLNEDDVEEAVKIPEIQQRIKEFEQCAWQAQRSKRKAKPAHRIASQKFVINPAKPPSLCQE